MAKVYLTLKKICNYFTSKGCNSSAIGKGNLIAEYSKLILKKRPEILLPQGVLIKMRSVAS